MAKAVLIRVELVARVADALRKLLSIHKLDNQQLADGGQCAETRDQVVLLHIARHRPAAASGHSPPGSFAQCPLGASPTAMASSSTKGCRGDCKMRKQSKDRLVQLLLILLRVHVVIWPVAEVQPLHIILHQIATPSGFPQAEAHALDLLAGIDQEVAGLTKSMCMSSCESSAAHAARTVSMIIHQCCILLAMLYSS